MMKFMKIAMALLILLMTTAFCVYAAAAPVITLQPQDVTTSFGTQVSGFSTLADIENVKEAFHGFIFYVKFF